MGVGSLPHIAKRRSWQLLVALAVSVAPPAAAETLKHRDLACDQLTEPRATAICRIMEADLEWTWTGHAIISPGYRMTLAGELRVYCEAEIAPEDTDILVRLSLEPTYATNPAQVQVQNSAKGLLKILGQDALDRYPVIDELPATIRSTASYLREEIALAIGPESTSIYSPSHPAYILRDGCPPEPSRR